MSAPKTLSIDIGGTGIKMMVLNAKGEAITERTRLPTPRPATPEAMIKTMVSMFDKHGDFDRVSAGFPGVVHQGVVHTAPNLDPSWANIDLAKQLSDHSGKPARVANDADVQGLGDIEGKGVEMVITLGTGMGAALFVDGKLVPNLELGHHPLTKNKTYEDLLSKEALAADGKKKWSKHALFAIETIQKIFNYDTLYVGGGNASHLKFELPPNVKKTKNIAGILGGIRLWDN